MIRKDIPIQVFLKEIFQSLLLEDLFPKMVHFGRVLSSAKIFKCFLPQKKSSPLTLLVLKEEVAEVFTFSEQNEICMHEC